MTVLAAGVTLGQMLWAAGPALALASHWIPFANSNVYLSVVTHRKRTAWVTVAAMWVPPLGYFEFAMRATDALAPFVEGLLP